MGDDVGLVQRAAMDDIPCRLIAAATKPRSAMVPTMPVSGEGLGSMPVTSWPSRCKRGINVWASQPDEPVTRMFTLWLSDV
jgi:hypothetical protein